MRVKIIMESVVVGLAAQVLVGWITPFTLLFTGLVAGLVSRREKEGTVAGLVLGIIVAIGFAARRYLGFSITYSYPALNAIALYGAAGVYIIMLIMVVLGIVGGRAGGSIMQGSIEESFKHGKMVGEGVALDAKYAKKARKHR